MRKNTGRICINEKKKVKQQKEKQGYISEKRKNIGK